MTTVIVYAEAYAIKESHGGGFRGVALNKITKEVKRGDRRDTMEGARNDAKRLAYELLNGRLYRPGYFRPTGTRWACNYWSA